MTVTVFEYRFPFSMFYSVKGQVPGKKASFAQ